MASFYKSSENEPASANEAQVPRFRAASRGPTGQKTDVPTPLRSQKSIFFRSSFISSGKIDGLPKGGRKPATDLRPTSEGADDAFLRSLDQTQAKFDRLREGARVKFNRLRGDIEKLSSEGVHIFCKSCSTKLTRPPLRNFVEIPSMNWQEVADNWFGGCCSFGGVSEKLVSKYLETFDCKEGTCQLDRASVAVCEDDLEGAVLERTISDIGMKSSESNDTISLCCDLVSSRACSDTDEHEVDPSYNAYSTQLGLLGTQNDIIMDCLNPQVNHLSQYNEKSLSESIGERPSKCDFHICAT